MSSFCKGAASIQQQSRSQPRRMRYSKAGLACVRRGERSCLGKGADVMVEGKTLLVLLLLGRCLHPARILQPAILQCVRSAVHPCSNSGTAKQGWLACSAERRCPGYREGRSFEQKSSHLGSVFLRAAGHACSRQFNLQLPCNDKRS